MSAMQKYQTEIKHNGYKLDITNFTDLEIENLKNDLSIIPKKCPGYGDENTDPMQLFTIINEKTNTYKRILN